VASSRLCGLRTDRDSGSWRRHEPAIYRGPRPGDRGSLQLDRHGRRACHGPDDVAASSVAGRCQCCCIGEQGGVGSSRSSTGCPSYHSCKVGCIPAGCHVRDTCADRCYRKGCNSAMLQRRQGCGGRGIKGQRVTDSACHVIPD